MRKTFISELISIAEKDPRVVLLTGDLGFMVLEPFAEAFPDRYFNVGVAEQNMVGVATGLADAGFIPFIYSIATFASLRPYEFIRNGPVLHHLPVRIVGVGGGFEYGFAGPTHHGLEDVGVMRVNPGLHVYAPADAAQTRTLLQKTWDLPAPIYYRLGKNDADIVPGLDGAYTAGQLNVVQQGADVLVLTSGSISMTAAQAAAQVTDARVTCAVVAAFNPMPSAALVELLQQHKAVITVEEHYLNGGLGSMVSELIAENGLDCQLQRCGIRQNAGKPIGSRQFLLKQHGLDLESLKTTIQAVI